MFFMFLVPDVMYHVSCGSVVQSGSVYIQCISIFNVYNGVQGHMVH